MKTVSELVRINHRNLGTWAIAAIATSSIFSTLAFAGDTSLPSGLQLVGVAEDGALVVSQVTSNLRIPSNTVLRSMEAVNKVAITQGATTLVNTRSTRGISGSGIQGISGSGLQGISGSGLQGISGSGLQGISGSGLQGISGSGLQGISGSGLQGISGSGLQGISGSGLQGISGSGLQGISGSGLQGISGSGLQGISGSGLQGISGSGLQGISGSGLQGISGSGLQGISGSGLQGISGSGLQGISGSGLQSLVAASTDDLSSSDHGSHNLLAVGAISATRKHGSEIVLVGQSISLDPSTVALEMKSGTGFKAWRTIKRSDIRTGQYVAVLGDPNPASAAHATMILVMPIQYAEGSTPVYVRGFVNQMKKSIGIAQIGSADIDLTPTLASGELPAIGSDSIIEIYGTAYDANSSGAGRIALEAASASVVD